MVHQSMQKTTPSKDLMRRETTAQPMVTVMPLVDIFENDEELLIVAEMPGAKRENLAVKFANDTLTLTCTRQLDKEGTLLLGELQPAEYNRSFVIPRGVDASKITAELKLGVLNVHLPKGESARARQIEVKQL